MSVQIVNSNPHLVSAEPIIICPGNKLLLFQTSAQIHHNDNVNSGFNGPVNTLWSFYWNDPAQNAVVGVDRLLNNC